MTIRLARSEARAIQLRAQEGMERCGCELVPGLGPMMVQTKIEHRGCSVGPKGGKYPLDARVLITVEILSNRSYNGIAMKLKVIVHEAEEGGYWAEVPSIPGCANLFSTARRAVIPIRGSDREVIA